MGTEHTPTPWEFVQSNDHHRPYVIAAYRGDVCDCYAMSNTSSLSVVNGGTSYPIHHQGEEADANAAFIVRAVNAHDDLVSALRESDAWLDAALGMVDRGDGPPNWDGIREHRKVITAALAKAAQS